MKMRRESYQEQKMQQRFQNPPIEMKREERSHFVAATCQQLCHTSANHAKAKMTKKTNKCVTCQTGFTVKMKRKK